MNELKQARLNAGLTQKSMAEVTGIPYRTITDWERGHRSPPQWVEKLVLKELKRIADAE